MAELQAIKPGNVHVFADGHGMKVEDFVQSAHVASEVIALPDLSVGQRIYRAIEATLNAVGCNTNLGIVLLAAPLVHAALNKQPLAEVLQNLTRDDAAQAFKAIMLAAPAGLGAASRYDVHDMPQCTLLEAMREAAGRDRIAEQYASAYKDVFEFGVARYRTAMACWDNSSWAVTAVYLGFLARFPDTHVARKQGMAVAETLRRDAEAHEAAFMHAQNPKTFLGELLRFDAALKREGLNPGTSADLTVASVLADLLERNREIILTTFPDCDVQSSGAGKST